MGGEGICKKWIKNGDIINFIKNSCYEILNYNNLEDKYKKYVVKFFNRDYFFKILLEYTDKILKDFDIDSKKQIGLFFYKEYYSFLKEYYIRYITNLLDELEKSDERKKVFDKIRIYLESLNDLKKFLFNIGYSLYRILDIFIRAYIYHINNLGKKEYKVFLYLIIHRGLRLNKVSGKKLKSETNKLIERFLKKGEKGVERDKYYIRILNVLYYELVIAFIQNIMVEDTEIREELDNILDKIKYKGNISLVLLLIKKFIKDWLVEILKEERERVKEGLEEVEQEGWKKFEIFR